MQQVSFEDAPWLKTVPADAVAALKDSCHERTCEAGEQLTQLGDAPGGLIGISRGVIAVHTDTSDELDLIAHVFWPGDWLGIAAILSDTPRFVGTSALTDARVLQLPSKALVRVANAQPMLWRGIAVLAGMGTQVATRIARDTLLKSPRDRCLATLLRLVGRQTLPCELPLTQSQFAGICGLSRGAVAKALRSLEETGEVERGYASLTVLKASQVPD